jgi:hypothetical protein
VHVYEVSEAGRLGQLVDVCPAVFLVKVYSALIDVVCEVFHFH